MAFNKERIENLETGLSALQDQVSRIEIDIADKLQAIKENLQRLTEAIVSLQEGFSNHQVPHVNPSHPDPAINDIRRAPFFPRTTKLEFPYLFRMRPNRVAESSQSVFRLPRNCCATSGGFGILPPRGRGQPMVAVGELHLQR